MQESNLNKAYQEAYERACQQLLSSGSETICQNTKAVYMKDTGTYRIRYFNQDCRIRCGDGSVYFENEPAELSITEKVLVLHYLINAKPKHLTGRFISFQEVPNGGAIYNGPFKKRAVDPLVRTFAGNGKGFGSAGIEAGGSLEAFGDASVTVFAFPYVPITYVLWQGDEEIPTSGTILFDASISDFLPAEDIVLAASFGAYRIIGAHKGGR